MNSGMAICQAGANKMAACTPRAHSYTIGPERGCARISRKNSIDV